MFTWEAGTGVKGWVLLQRGRFSWGGLKGSLPGGVGYHSLCPRKGGGQGTS